MKRLKMFVLYCLVVTVVIFEVEYYKKQIMEIVLHYNVLVVKGCSIVVGGGKKQGIRMNGI